MVPNRKLTTSINTIPVPRHWVGISYLAEIGEVLILGTDPLRSYICTEGMKEAVKMKMLYSASTYC